MADLEVKRKDGKAAGKVKLSEKIANAPAKLVSTHRTVVAEEANKRQGTQSAKTRSETRGGGRKPYKQKKTGNARQGSTRSPHYAHGSMALAVKPRDYEKKINRKERRAAILGAFSAHLEAGNVIAIDTLVFAEAKTRQATDLLAAFGLAGARRVLVILSEYDETTYKCFRNLKNVEVRTAPAIVAEGAEAPKTAVFSARDLLLAKKIIIAKDALAKIEEVWAEVKSPYAIILKPHITERSVALSYGDERTKEETQLVRKYTFLVATDSNKIEIKNAIEAIYNNGKKPDEAIKVTSVRTIKVLGKKRRRSQKTSGYEPDRKKAIITLDKGQMLEDYGV